MALTIGTNCGFVESAPSGDPGVTAEDVDNVAVGFRDTSPVGATTITEIGWYCSVNPGSTGNFEVP